MSTIPGQRGALQRNLYNGLGEREFREAYNLPRHFGYDESGRLLFETEGVPGVPSSTVRQRYLWLDDQPIAVKNSSDAYAGEGKSGVRSCFATCAGVVSAHVSSSAH